MHANSVNNTCLANFNCATNVRIGNTSPVSPCDVNVESSVNGDVSTLVLNQQSGNANDHASVNLISGGTSGGSTILSCGRQGSVSWVSGIDVSTSNFVIASQGSLTNAELMVVTPTNQVLYPRRSCFVVFSDVTQSNTTGDGTIYTSNFNIVNANRGANYDGVNTYTAPINGFYLFSAGITLTNVTQTLCLVSILTSANEYIIFRGNGNKISDSSNTLTCSGSCIAFMLAGATAKVKIQVSGGAKTVSVSGIQGDTYFDGQLMI